MRKELRGTLKPHQVIAVKWMKKREEGLYGGGILADDMGLGKTITTIALILANRAPPSAPSKTTLIIVPSTLKEQWREQIKTWTRSLSVYVYHGSNRPKDAATLLAYDIVITTYDLLWRERPKPESESKPSKKTALFQAKFYRVILDEAQAIKNRESKTSLASVDVFGAKRWCLSGTPIQNSIKDLFGYLRFLGPIARPFDQWYAFNQKILCPLERNYGPAMMQQINAYLQPLMLRRTKFAMIDGKRIIDLPERIVYVVTIPFDDFDELSFYTNIKERTVARLTRFDRAGDFSSEHLFIWTLMLRLRQACVHAFLVTKKIEADDVPVARTKCDSEDDLDDLSQAIGRFGITERQKTCLICEGPVFNDELCGRCMNNAMKFSSASSTKFRKAIEILREIRAEPGNKKTLIFSQWTSTFGLLEPLLQREGVNYVMFVGSMSTESRDRALWKIRNDPAVTVMLVSLKCASVGLNLTACCRVILLDPSWNPAVDNQAIDRVHRMGQKEVVKVWKITIQGTIEDRLLEIQAAKAELAAAALNDGGDIFQRLDGLSIKEMRSIIKG